MNKKNKIYFKYNFSKFLNFVDSILDPNRYAITHKGTKHIPEYFTLPHLRLKYIDEILSDDNYIYILDLESNEEYDVGYFMYIRGGAEKMIEYLKKNDLNDIQLLYPDE